MSEEDAEEFHEWLLGIFKRERSEEALSQIPEDFMDRLYAYVTKVRNLLKVYDRKSVSFLMRSAELESIKKTVSSLFELRYRKILYALLLRKDVGSLMEVERQLYESISRAMHDYEQKIISLSHDLRLPTKLEAPTRYEIVCFMQNFPKIVGEDLKSYGPFRQFDIATLPIQNALAMMGKKVVRDITIR